MGKSAGELQSPFLNRQDAKAAKKNSLKDKKNQGDLICHLGVLGVLAVIFLDFAIVLGEIRAKPLHPPLQAGAVRRGTPTQTPPSCRASSRGDGR